MFTTGWRVDATPGGSPMANGKKGGKQGREIDTEVVDTEVSQPVVLGVLRFSLLWLLILSWPNFNFSNL